MVSQVPSYYQDNAVLPKDKSPLYSFLHSYVSIFLLIINISSIDSAQLRTCLDIRRQGLSTSNLKRKKSLCLRSRILCFLMMRKGFKAFIERHCRTFFSSGLSSTGEDFLKEYVE